MKVRRKVQMKLLKKMLLINWHYIRFEAIDFSMINFLTGKNASGKSTIIDALQLVMLGDTSGHYFNKSASESSKRTLKGYLLGELGDDGESGFRYLREGKYFSSYIALEFNDTEKKRSFTAGIVFDIEASGDFTYKFFILRASIPENNFLKNEEPLSIKDLRIYFNNNYKNHFEFPESNKSYQNVFLGEMGGLNQKFFSLFKKSVQFTPISDIEKFISEFVCDVKAKVDIVDMQNNIRNYKQLEYDAAVIKKRIEKLRDIEESYKSYKLEADRFLEQSYLIDRGNLMLSQNNIIALKSEMDRIVDENITKNNELLSKNKEKGSLEDDKVNLLSEKFNSDIYKKNYELTRKKDELEKTLKEIENTMYTLVRRLNTVGLSWRQNVDEILRCSDINPIEINTYAKEILNETARLIKVNEGNVLSITRIELSDLKKTMKNYLGSLNSLYYNVETELKETKNELNQIQQEIDNLKKGIKPYDEKVLELKNGIEKRLNIKADILCDVIDVSSDKWRNAIEGYLHTQKFYLLTAPEYFIPALKIYDEIKFKNNLYDVGLVDIKKIMERVKKVESGSLAEEIYTENDYARAYCDYVLGRVMKCEKVEDLNKHNISITPTCMLYQNYTARQLNPERWKNPYIGKASIEKLIKNKEENYEILDKKRIKLTGEYAFLDKAIKIEPLTESDIDNAENDIVEIRPYDEIKNKLQNIVIEINNLDITYLVKVDEKIEEVNKKIKGLDGNIQNLISEIKINESTIKTIRNIKLPEEEKARVLNEEILNKNYDNAWIEAVGEPRFIKELEIRKDVKNIISIFPSVKAGTATRKDSKFKQLTSSRSEYNSDYKMSFDINFQDNSTYERELSVLRDTKLAEYENKIKDAGDRAQKQFQEDFISKLKQNIDTVRSQIDEMNGALKNTNFGKDKYRFEAKPNNVYRKFYDMIMDSMLMEGFNLFSQNFQSKHRDAIDELFKQIVDVGEGNLNADQRSILEKNIDKYTDYRTYLSFDLVVKNENGIESRLSRVLSKKSGGETQTPFYISVLASFLQRYRIKSKNNNTLRLIVFDEAFNKMDSERIQESINLLRNLEFQAVISAPTEKIADIAPLVDRNLCVMRVKDRTLVKAFDKKK